MTDQKNDEPPSDEFFNFMANDLRRHWAQQTKEEQEYEELFGPIDENLLAEYQDGKCTADERKQVEEAMKHFPALREALDASAAFDQEQARLAGGDAPVQNPPKRSFWTNLTKRSGPPPKPSR